jgi:hypothetical protein
VKECDGFFFLFDSGTPFFLRLFRGKLQVSLECCDEPWARVGCICSPNRGAHILGSHGRCSSRNVVIFWEEGEENRVGRCCENQAK